MSTGKAGLIGKAADRAIIAASKGQFIGAPDQQPNSSNQSAPPPARGPPNDQLVLKLSPELELRKVLTLAQVSEITSLSEDSLKRHHADKIKRLGPRRLGMTLGDALAIGEPVSETAAP